MRYTSTTYEETNGGNTKRVWFNVNMENEDEIFRFTEALIRVLVKICDFDEDELEEEWMNMSFDSDIGEPDFDGIQEFWNQYAGRVLEELWSIDQDAFEISDFVEEEVEKKPYEGSGDDGFAAAMFPVKEGQRDVSIMRQFKKGFEVLDKELATIPSIYKALTEFKFKVGSEDFNGDYVITIAFDKDVIDIQNVYWYLKGEKEKVKMTSNWSKEKAAAVIINGRLEYDDVYLMESLVGTEMYITNATPTKEYLQESKNLQESFTPGRCWDGRGETMEKQNEGLFQTKTSKEYEDAWNTIWDSIGTEDEFKSLEDIRSFIYSRPKRFPKLNADVDKFSMRLWQAYKLNTDIEYETGLKDYDQPLYGDMHHSEPVYTESNKSSRERVAENAGRRIASAKVKHSVWGFNIDWCRIASKTIADAIGADAYDLFLDDDDYDTIILKYDGKVPLTPEQKMKARETLIKVVGEKDLELSQSKSLNESYDSDTRTSVKVEFRGRDSDEVEDIVEDVNELHNTTFFAHELGNKVYIESSTLFTSVAKLEDILEEFISRGANEIRFIKA